MYAHVRTYEGIADPQETGRIATDSFLPVITKLPGFIGYFFVDTGNGSMVSMSIYEDEASADESTRVASDWVRDHPNLIPKPATVAEGPVVMSPLLAKA
jgi:hypothetical protein